MIRASDLAWVLGRHDLTPTARLLLVRLWMHVNDRDDEAVVWPTIGVLAAGESLTERGIYKLLADLRAAGLIERHDTYAVARGGSTIAVRNAFVLHRPPMHSDAPPCTDVHPDLHHDSGGPCTAVQSHLYGTDQRNEEQNDPPPAAPDIVEEILGLMRLACESLRGRKGAGPDDCAANRTLITRCNKAVRAKGQNDAALLADWATVIDRQLANVKHRPETWKYLSLSTLCRSANFLRLRDSVAGTAARRAAFTPSRDDDD